MWRELEVLLMHAQCIPLVVSRRLWMRVVWPTGTLRLAWGIFARDGGAHAKQKRWLQLLQLPLANFPLVPLHPPNHLQPKSAAHLHYHAERPSLQHAF